MKRLLALSLGLLLLCAAGIGTGVSADDSVTVKVGIYENQPKIFTGEQGNPDGFWPEITSYIAAKEGWQIEWVHGTWTQCLARLENEEMDLMPDVAYTEERDRLYDFSQETVYVSWSRVYARDGIDIQSILDLEGINIAVLEGSVNVEGPEGIKTLTEAFCINCTFIYVDSYVKVFELVDKGEADVGVVSKDFAYRHESTYNLIETPIIFQPVRLYFAFPPDSTLKPYLIEKIDENIKELKEHGDSIYYQLLKKWFGTEPISQPVMPDWSVWLLIGFGILAVVFGGGTLILRAQVKKSTRQLAEDIERRKKTEKELRESEEKLLMVLETVPLGLVVLDLEGKIIQANRTALQMGSYNNSDLIGNNYLDFVVKRDHEKARTNIKNALEIGFFGSTEYTLLKKSGEEFPTKVNITLIKDALNNPAGFVTVIEDITPRKRSKR